MRNASLSALRELPCSSSSSDSCMCRSHTQAPKRLRSLTACRRRANCLFRPSCSVSWAGATMATCSFSSSSLASSPCFSCSQRSRSDCTRWTMDSTEALPFLAAVVAANRSPKSRASTRQFVEEQLGVETTLAASANSSGSSSELLLLAWCWCTSFSRSSMRARRSFFPESVRFRRRCSSSNSWSAHSPTELFSAVSSALLAAGSIACLRISAKDSLPSAAAVWRRRVSNLRGRGLPVTAVSSTVTGRRALPTWKGSLGSGSAEATEWLLMRERAPRSSLSRLSCSVFSSLSTAPRT
mmetsp:Transcript_40117/g.128757  ORF Transcript_40117/g.128757 Transcript_40117/m.128757 type:complete len:297 (-) Transcript_40117:178-1068(-)